MAFTIFQKDYYIDASEMSDNFFHIAQGDLLPRGGTSLTPTTGVNDLGSEDYYWRELFVNSATGDIGCIRSLTDVEVTAGTVRVEITGLNGDDYEEFVIMHNMLWDYWDTKSSITLHPNGESGASHIYKFVENRNGVTIIWHTTTADGLRLCYFNYLGTSSFGKTVLKTKTGEERLLHGTHGSGAALPQHSQEIFSVWSNTSSTITSLVFIMHTSSSYSYKVRVYGIY